MTLYIALSMLSDIKISEPFTISAPIASLTYILVGEDILFVLTQTCPTACGDGCDKDTVTGKLVTPPSVFAVPVTPQITFPFAILSAVIPKCGAKADVSFVKKTSGPYACLEVTTEFGLIYRRSFPSLDQAPTTGLSSHCM